MLRYTIKRVLLLIPAVITISIITFLIAISAPGDPVERMLDEQVSGGSYGDANYSKAYIAISRKIGMDLPAFYFSIVPSSFPDTLHRIPFRSRRAILSKLLYSNGNWEKIESWSHAIDKFSSALASSDNPERGNHFISAVNLSTLYREQEIITQLAAMEEAIIAGSLLEPFKGLKQAFESMNSSPERWRIYIPSIRFHGANNRYHRWISGLIKGSFGTSLQTRRPIEDTIWDRLLITLRITSISILLIFLIAVPLGVMAAMKKGKWQERTTMLLLFMLYSLPNFWIGTLMVIFLCCGDFLCLFPPYGLGGPGAADALWHLVLPVACFVYPGLAFLARQMRGGIIAELSQEYIKTARAKGLTDQAVVWKHALRNSLLPAITIIANIFPLLIGGSVVIEYIFNIPGMGLFGYEAVIFRDYPVVFSVLMLSAAMTLLGFLVSDILYALADPRINYSGKK